MKMLLGLTVSTVVVLFLAPAATAQYYAGGNESSANLTTVDATEAISQQRQPCNRSTKPVDKASLAVPSVSVALIQERQPCFSYLRKTGGPPLVTPLVAGALVVAVGSGVAIRVILRNSASP
jgi:hypothetical protein